MPAIELSYDAMSAEQKHLVLECAVYDSSMELGKDPLQLLLELEQLAAEEGYANVHDFINDYTR